MVLGGVMSKLSNIAYQAGRAKTFLLLAVSGLAFIYSFPVSAYHCNHMEGCPKQYPPPPVDADKGAYSKCDWPDGVHYRCGYGGRSDPPEHQCTAQGSIISVEDQRLGEDVKVVGTPFWLHYESDRVPGRDGTVYGTPFDARVLGLGGWTLNVNHFYTPRYTKRVYLGAGQKRGPEVLGNVFKASSNTNHFTAGEFLIAGEGDNDIYVFDDKGKHLRTLNTLTGNIIYQFKYDRSNRLISITDENSRVTTIERDPQGNPTAIIAPYGQRTKLTLNNQYLSEITDPDGKSFKAEYTPKGLLKTFTDPRGNIRSYDYDELGRLKKAADPVGGVQTLNRTNQYNGYKVTFTDAADLITDFLVENDLKQENGQPSVHSMTRTVTPPGTSPIVSVDDPFNVRLVSKFPDGSQQDLSTLQDPQWGRQNSLPQRQAISFPSSLKSSLEFSRQAQLSDPADPLSLVSQTDTWTFNGKISQSTYDAANQTFTDVSPAGRKVKRTIDAKGRLTKTLVPGLYATDYVYDSNGRLKSLSQGSGTDVRTIRFGYGADGFLESITNSLDQKTTFKRNAAGWLTQEVRPDGQAIGFAYDANGNVTEVRPAGQPSHSFDYSGVDLPSSYKAPQVGTEPNQTRYDYNLDRQLTQITLPDSKTIILDYDTAGRLSTAKIAPGSLVLAYENGTDNVNSITAPDGIGLAYSYDGSLLTSVSLSGPVAGKVNYTYNSDLLVAGLSLNGDTPVSFQYDDDSLLTKAGNLTLTRNDQNDLLTGTALGSITDSYSYDSFAEVTAYEAKYGTTSLLRFEYTYDNLGRITQKKEVLGGTATHMYNYGYDTAERLVEVKRDGTTVANYGYDANGNRTQLNGVTVSHYDDQDRLLDYQGATYQYMANGELRQKTVAGKTTQYDYDVLGNLRKVTLPDNTEIDYLIDGQNRKIGKKVNGTLVQAFLYQGQLQPIAELDGSGNVISRFVYATHVNVPDYIIKGGVTYRVITDHLGSPRVITNASDGTVVQRMDYDEFGNVLADTNPGFQPFGFAGGLYDHDTKLIRFGARDYEAETGRWTAKDPSLFKSGTTNLFLYASDDPINFSDQDGLRLRISWLTEQIFGPLFWPETLESLKKALKLLEQPDCTCALRAANDQKMAPWEETNIDIVIDPFVGAHGASATSNPIFGIIYVDTVNIGANALAGVLAHEAGHFTYPYLGHEKNRERFAAENVCGAIHY
jgi:RHS repeat-associated protein